jgi:serine/threonine-protein kinase RsbW
MFIMTSETPTSYSLVVESKPSEVVRVCDEVLAKLKEKGFGKDDIFAVHLTLEEAFLNAVKHGNKQDPAKKVMVDYSVTHEKLEITVTDQGNGFKPDNVADPRFGENLFKPGGRGLLLMNSYMDVVKYNEQGNSVYMVRYKEEPFHRKESSDLANGKD